ncbi:MAG TPA: HD domain-containing phosphohydrolase [Clostridia bacterium]
MSFLSFKQFLYRFKEDYLYTKLRIAEFIVCIISIPVLTFLLSSGSFETQAFLGQLPGLFAVYLAFRFGAVGMVIAIASCIKDLYLLIMTYLNTRYYTMLVGMIFVALTIIWVLIVGIISNKQEKHRREMQKIAITDDLTGVFNQKHFHSNLNDEFKNLSKAGSSIGLIIIDIDNFRMYNDLYGMDFGDTILKNTAAILKKIVNKNDRIYRFGGDEFAILTINTSSEALEAKAKKIYQKYEELKKDFYIDSSAGKVTFSIGSSEYPGISKSKEELISHANMALYQAKNMGEDKVHFYRDIILHIEKNVMPDQQMIGAFKGLLSTIVAKDKYTFGHCERVSTYAVMICEAIGMELEEIQTIKQASLLHDIGKIELPKWVLNKAGHLTSEEFRSIRQHPVNSAYILEPLSGIANLIDYVKHHHERYDGSGYPDGIKGENISLGARIIGIADSFDAMVSDRPYRKGMPIEDAFREIEKCSGSQFDPNVAKVFINAMRNKMFIKYNYNFHNNDGSYKEHAMQ